MPDLSEFDDLADCRCVVGRHVGSLTEEQQESYAAAEGKGYSNTVLLRWLKKHGGNEHLRTRSVSRHRERVCGCFDD